jgi:lipid-binding SYLF domain-containing protein
MLQVQSHRQTARLPALMLIVLALLTGCASLSPEEAQAKREEIDQMEAATLARLLETRPELQSVFDASPGYAVGDMKLTKIPVFGGSVGPGVVVDKRTDARTYLRVTRFDVGGGMGIATFKVVILFQDPELLEQAITGFWHFEGGAEAGAGSASAEASVAGTSTGYQVFKLADSGALATVTVRMVRARPYFD